MRGRFFGLVVSRAILVSAVKFSTAISMATKDQGKTAALIFLHGLGDTPVGWSSLKSQLPMLKPRLVNVEYVFPSAPTIPISINGGATMPGWFDLFDWPISIGSKDDREQKLKCVREMKEIVKKLQSEQNIYNIVIGGFSQGGAIALLSAFHPEESILGLKGCVSLSGWLTLTDDLKSFDEHSTKVPLFWGHGQYDDKVLFEQQAHGVGKLRELGLSHIEDFSYPIGHSSHEKELAHMADFLDRVFFGSEDSKDEL